MKNIPVEYWTKPEDMTYDALLRFFLERGESCLDALQDCGGAMLREDYKRIYDAEMSKLTKQAKHESRY